MRTIVSNAIVVIVGALLAIPAFAAGPVTVTSTPVQLTLRGPDLANPGTNLLIAFAPGLATTGTIGPLSNTGGSASADFSFAGAAFAISNLNYAIQGQSSLNNTLAELSAFGVRFTPDVDVTWNLSGSLAWSPGASQSTVAIFNKIIDVTDFASPVQITLDNHSKSGTSKAVTATVGAALSGGINTTGITGGMLLAGHNYEWDFDYAVYTGGSGGGPATGGVTLSFTAIPEPAMLSAMAILAAAAFLRRSRRFA